MPRRRPKRKLITQVAASRLAIPKAYAKAAGSAGVAKGRQVYYAARDEMLQLTGATSLDSGYFRDRLLHRFMEEHPELTADWNIIFDARGHLIEPHTGNVIALGTQEVRDYIESRAWRNRYHTLLYIEKEGFQELFEAVQFAERWDLAIASAKGMSTTAARSLIDALAADGVRVLCLHDYDVAGITMFGILGRDTDRYQWKTPPNVVNLGLRFEDIGGLPCELADESTRHNPGTVRRTLIEKNGVSEAEADFLVTHRVELNAFTNDEFIQYLEHRLAQENVTKLIPDDDILEEYFERNRRWRIDNMVVDEFIEQHRAEIDHETQERIDALDEPEDLTESIREQFQERPYLAWDTALDIIEEACQ